MGTGKLVMATNSSSMMDRKKRVPHLLLAGDGTDPGYSLSLKAAQGFLT